MREVARHEHSVPCRRALWGDNFRAPRDVTMGVARETALASSTIIVF